MVSQHPVDQLIRDLIHSKREATSEEVQQIIQRLATAPFNQEVIPVSRVSPELLNATYLGQSIGTEANSLTVHLFKRVLLEEQWAEGTTADDYLSDLRRAVIDPSAQLLLYKRRGGNIAAVLAQNIVPESRQGRRREPYVYVLYSADHGKMISGYQTRGRSELKIPEDTLWLT